MLPIIRPITPADADAVLAMMRVFYASPAVHTNGSEDIFRRDMEACLSDSPYLEGFVFEVCPMTVDVEMEACDVCADTPNHARAIAGYAMLAKSFSTEFGKRCIWIEDIYIDEAYRGLGLGTAFLAFVEERYPNAVYRLEVEEENERAVHIYRKCGFEFLPYAEMKKER